MRLMAIHTCPDVRKVASARLMVHRRSIFLRSCTMVECMNAVAVSQGRNEAFSTGSHAQ